MRKLKFILPVVAIGLMAFGWSNHTSSEAISIQSEVEDEGIQWMTIEEAASALENGTNLPVFIDVYTDWCGWCKRQDATTFSDPKVVEYMNSHFLNVKLNAEQTEDIVIKGQTFKFVAQGRRGYHEFAATIMNGKMSYPTVVFLDAELHNLSPVPGYRPAHEFLPIATYFGDGIYLEKTWEEYTSNSTEENSEE